MGWIEYADGVEVVGGEEVEEVQVGPARPQSVHHLVPCLEPKPVNHHRRNRRALTHHQDHHAINHLHLHLSSLLRHRWYLGCGKDALNRKRKDGVVEEGSEYQEVPLSLKGWPLSQRAPWALVKLRADGA